MTVKLIGVWGGGASPLILNDDVLYRLGTDGDQVMLNRSTTLGANTALTNALLGTPVTEALAANSLLISGVTASGSIMVAGNRGGNSESYIFIDPATGNFAVHSRGSGSFDIYDDATQILDYITGAFAFQQTVTVSSTVSPLVFTTAAGGEVVVNDASADVNWRWESDTNDQGLNLDAGAFGGVGAYGVGRAVGTFTYFMIGYPAITATASTDFAMLGLRNNGAVTVPTGTTNIVTSAYFDEPNIIATGTVTNGVTLYVQAAPTEGTNNYAIWSDAGFNRFDGKATFGGTQGTAITSGDVFFNTGFVIGTDSTNNLFSVASAGAGTTTMYIGNASINVTSDIRVKSNIMPYLGNALALFRHIPVAEYDMNDAYRPFGGIYTGRYVGITAQALYEQVPWAVNTQGGKDCWKCLVGLPCEAHLPWQVRYELMAGLFVKGFQEVEERLLALERR